MNPDATLVIETRFAMSSIAILLQDPSMVEQRMAACKPLAKGSKVSVMSRMCASKHIASSGPGYRSNMFASECAQHIETLSRSFLVCAADTVHTRRWRALCETDRRGHLVWHHYRPPLPVSRSACLRACRWWTLTHALAPVQLHSRRQEQNHHRAAPVVQRTISLRC